MSDYKNERNVPGIIIRVIVALVALGTIAVIAVGIIYSKQADFPSGNMSSNETDSGITETDMPTPDIPVITPGTEQGKEETNPPEETTEPGHISVDILDVDKDIEKESRPHIVGDVSVLPGVKEKGHEKNR